VEVFRLEQSASLADRRRQNRRVDSQEPTLVKEVVDRLLDLIADRKDRAYTIAAQPKVPVVEQEIDSVLLRLHGVVDRAHADNCETRHAQFVPAGRARLGAHLTRHMDGRFECKFLETLPNVRWQLRLDEYRLNDAGAVAQYGERHFPRRSDVRDPT